jgi:hypothetical protein
MSMHEQRLCTAHELHGSGWMRMPGVRAALAVAVCSRPVQAHWRSVRLSTGELSTRLEHSRGAHHGIAAGATLCVR